jgi:NAD(P)-dependent dehydrogenase (short-subunit alcohol dehydrogenase family)
MSTEAYVQGKVVVITGGASGIGAALAERVSAEGGRAASLDIQAPLKPRQQPVLDLTADITDERSVESALDEVERQLGPVDVLVHGAAIEGPLDDLTNVELTGWEQAIRINLTGTFIVNKLVARRMVARRGGRIINISSSAGVSLSPGQGPYNISKAAVTALTKQIAQEVFAHGVLVNCIDPGGVNTTLNDDLLTRDLSQASKNAQAFQAACREFRDNGFLMEPEEVLDLIIFLASDVSKHIAGQFIRISTGEGVAFK